MSAHYGYSTLKTIDSNGKIISGNLEVIERIIPK